VELFASVGIFFSCNFWSISDVNKENQIFTKQKKKENYEKHFNQLAQQRPIYKLRFLKRFRPLGK